MTNWNEAELEKALQDNPELSTETSPDARQVRVITQKGTLSQPSKYHSVRTEYNGKIFPSKKEAKTARDLDLLQKAGSFDFYLSQVNFPLKDGTTYRADFVTFKFWSTGHNPGCSEPIKYGLWIIKVVEPKGYETREWKRKLRLFRESYPNLEIEVI